MRLSAQIHTLICENSDFASLDVSVGDPVGQKLFVFITKTMVEYCVFI